MEEKSLRKQFLMLGLGLVVLILGSGVIDSVRSWLSVVADVKEKSDEATEKLKDFFLDEKEPYHPDRPVSDPSPLPVSKKEIIVFSEQWCEPCQRWKRCEAAKFEAMGYTFAYGDSSTVKRLPHFIVCDGQRTVEISGYMTPERLESELRK